MNEIANFLDGDITDEKNAHMREDVAYSPTDHDPMSDATVSKIEERL